MRLTDRIFGNSRMELEFFMYAPEGTYTSRDHSTVAINLNPVLYLRFKPPKNVAMEYDYQKAAYKITPRNYYQVIKFFNTTMEWLYGDEYKSLFLNNEEGQLIFNADYSKLNVTMPITDYTTQYMQAIPSVVQIGDKTYEGIRIFINKKEYCISLTFEEVGMLFGILMDFRFSREADMVLSAFYYLESHRAIKEASNNPPGSIRTPFDD